MRRHACEALLTGLTKYGSTALPRASVSDVEIALREALANAILHGNHEDRRKHVHVTCRCEPDEVSIAVKDEGKGFDADNVPDPTAPQNIGAKQRVRHPRDKSVNG